MVRTPKLELTRALLPTNKMTTQQQSHLKEQEEIVMEMPTTITTLK
jgi:hypothetical protein